MNNYMKIIFIVIFFSSCSFLEKKKYNSNCLQKTQLNQNFLNKNYIGMTRKEIIYIFGMPIIADAFNDVYHYHLDSQKKMLNLYFKNNRVLSFNIK